MGLLGGEARREYAISIQLFASSRRPPYIPAHDLGTTGNKATLFSTGGAVVGATSSAHDTTYPQPNWAEQDPTDWWHAVRDSTRELLSTDGVLPSDIAVVSFSGMMNGMLPVDIGPVNIGCPQYITVDELANTIAEVAGKEIHLKYVEGPVGVQSRNFSNERIYSIGWQARYYLRDGIAQNYPWMEEQVRNAQEAHLPRERDRPKGEDADDKDESTEE